MDLGFSLQLSFHRHKSLKPHILFNSNGLAIWQGFPVPRSGKMSHKLHFGKRWKNDTETERMKQERTGQ